MKPLTDREVEVLQAFAEGLSPPQVAKQLHIAKSTVKNHLASAYEKLKVEGRSQAIAKATAQGLLTPPGGSVRLAAVDGEQMSVHPVTGAQKGTKLARFDLLPMGPITLLAEHYGRGARKYPERNWEAGYEWSKSFAAMMRHLAAWWNGEDIDEETGSNHLVAAMWHCAALLEFSRTHPELDDRPKRGGSDAERR